MKRRVLGLGLIFAFSLLATLIFASNGHAQQRTTSRAAAGKGTSTTKTIKQQPKRAQRPVAPEPPPPEPPPPNPPAPPPEPPKESAPSEPSATELPIGVPLPVRVGIIAFVTNVSKINEQTGTFEATLTIKYLWRDPRLAFSARDVGSDKQDFADEAAVKKLEQIWSPGLSLTSLSDKPARLDHGLLLRADGSVTHVQSVRASFDARYALNAFPFDTQALPIRITSTRYNFNEVALIQRQEEIDRSGLRDDLRIQGWAPVALVFESSRVQGWNGDFYPEMTGKILVRREAAAHVFTIFTPFFLVMLVASVMTLYAKIDTAFRLSAWGGAILALVALNFTFSVKYPFLGSDSVVQQLVVIGYNYQLMMVLLTMTLFHPDVAGKLSNQRMVEELRLFARWSVPVLFLGAIAARCLLTAFS